MNKKIAIIYHKDCHDGFSAAWAAYKKFGNKAMYLGAVHQEAPPKIKNKEVYFVDFVYPEKIFKKIISDNKKVVAIDHHISVAKTISLADEHVYDLGHSGAFLAWRYFHPQKPIPRLIKYVEEQDIWKFKLPKTREINVAIKFAKFNFVTWDKLARDLEDAKTRKKYIEQGEVMLAYRNNQIKELVETASYLVKFAGYKVLATNAPYFFASQLGHELVEKGSPFAIVWSHLGDIIRVSLRSDGDKIDVSKIAARYGGGGHKAASGFNFSASEKFPWTVLKKH